jgi:hypothetical protein
MDAPIITKRLAPFIQTTRRHIPEVFTPPRKPEISATKIIVLFVQVFIILDNRRNDRTAFKACGRTDVYDEPMKTAGCLAYY